MKSGDCKFWNCQQASVVSYGADYDKRALGWGHLFASAAAGEHDEAGEGHWGAVDAGHEEAAEDDFVEGGVGTACDVYVSGSGRVECGQWGIALLLRNGQDIERTG